MSFEVEDSRWLNGEWCKVGRRIGEKGVGMVTWETTIGWTFRSKKKKGKGETTSI